MSIKDKNLEKIIKMNLLYNNKTNINDVSELCIQNKNFLGNYLNINLSEIKFLKKLKSLSLKFFEIDNKIIDILNSMDLLTKIEFEMCNFNNNISLDDKFESLRIHNCTNFNSEFINNMKNLKILDVYHSGIIDIGYFKRFKLLETLKINDCIIINLHEILNLENLENLYLNKVELRENINIGKMNKLKYICLNGSKVIDKQTYIKELKSQNMNIIIEFEDSVLPFE